MNQQHELFFKYLSDRPWKENNISDFIFALFKTSTEFYKIFRGIIINKYPTLKDKFVELVSIEREYRYKEGRADLVLLFKNEVGGIAIEVKIYDRNYHQTQYSYLQDNDNMTICLIDTVSDNNNNFPGWVIITWEELINELLKSKDIFLQSISDYFSGAIKMETIKPINFSKLQHILYFNRLIKRVITEYPEKINIYRRATGFFEDGSGNNFEFHCSEGKILWSWFGLNYNEEHPEGIMIWIQRGPNKDLFNDARDIMSTSKKKEDYLDISNNDIVFMMSKEDFERFKNIESVDEQYTMLKTFLRDFIDRFKLKILDPI